MYNENEDDDFSESQIDENENWALVYEYSREYEKKIVFLFGPVKASAILDQMFSKYFVSLRITDY